MNIKTKSLASCPICGGGYKKIYSINDLLYKTCDNYFNVSRCLFCRHFFTSDLAENIGDIYPPEYKVYKECKLEYQERWPVLRKILKRMGILSFFLSDPISSFLHSRGNGNYILDIGCANGKGVQVYKKKYPNNFYHGFDVSEHCVKSATKVLDEVFIDKNGILSYNFKNKYNIVRMYHVLEHISEPILALKKIYNILTKDGILVIQVPNIRSLNYYLFKKDWWPLDIPRHFHHFSDKGIEEILLKNGFNVKKIIYSSSPYTFIRSFSRKFFSNPDNFKRNYNKIILLVINLLFKLVNIFKFSDTITIIAHKKNEKNIIY